MQKTECDICETNMDKDKSFIKKGNKAIYLPGSYRYIAYDKNGDASKWQIPGDKMDICMSCLYKMLKQEYENE